MSKVPKLRFPEFKGEWEEKELGEISELLKGKGLSKKDIYEDGENSCIHYGELFTIYTEIILNVKSKTAIKEGFYSKENDILMPTSDVTPNGLAKASCIKLDNVLIGADILVIRPKDNIKGEFLSRNIRSKETDILKLVSGTTIFHLYASSMNNFKVSFPSTEEQQKIADCLSSLDELIEARREKIASLKAYKKGLLQQLFPQEVYNNYPPPSADIQ